MKLWPESLRARVLLVAGVGLLAAILASQWLFWDDRGRFTRQLRFDFYAERVAAAVRLLEGVDVDRRGDVIRVLRGPHFHAELLPRFSAVDGGRGDPELAGDLRRQIGERVGGGRRIACAVHGRGLPGREGRPMRPATAVDSVVELEDGSAARFSARLSMHRPEPPWRLLAFTALALLAVFAASMLAIRAVVRPLQRIAGQAREIGADLDTPPLAEEGPGEVRQVAAAMNAMQQRLRQLFRQRGQFLAAVSHDLKTPITRLRLRLEAISEPALRERMEQDLAEMQWMVDQTLEFMRDDAGRERASRVDLSALLESLAEDFGDTGCPVAVGELPRIVLTTRPRALRRCLDNLVNNACRHGGGARLGVERDDAAVRIFIDDDGPGIPERELDRVFEPYYRLDDARGGAGNGLGLAIARGIAETLGGTLQLANRSPRGLRATVALPAPD